MATSRPAATLLRSLAKRPSILTRSSLLPRATAPQPQLLRQQLQQQQPLPLQTLRFRHTIPKPPQQPSTVADQQQQQQREQQQQQPKRTDAHYQLTFTCVPCSNRSTHQVSKQGYHKGSVLITCPSCRNRHIISDHLNIFGDRKITVEDLMREKGQLVKRGTLGEDGDVEFWADEGAEEELTAEARQKS